MHKILVHAQDSCACTTPAGPARGGCFFWVQALVPGPSSACTRVLCMHKSVVHAQESCACTRILYYHIILLYCHIILSYHVILLLYHIIISRPKTVQKIDSFDLFLKFVRSSGIFRKTTYTQ